MRSIVRASRQNDIQYSLFYDDGISFMGRSAPSYDLIVTHWDDSCTELSDPRNYHRSLLSTDSLTEAVSMYHLYVMGRKAPAIDLPVLNNMLASQIFSWEQNHKRGSKK